MTSDSDDSYLEWYVGEFWLYRTVFTVFRIAEQPGWFSVFSFNGRPNSPVCEFRLDSDPIWSDAWKAARSKHSEVAAQARWVVKRPKRE